MTETDQRPYLPRRVPILAFGMLLWLGQGCAMVSPRMPTYAPQSAPGSTVVPSSPQQLTPTPERSIRPVPQQPVEQRPKPEPTQKYNPVPQAPPKSSPNGIEDAPLWNDIQRDDSSDGVPWRSNLPPLPAPGDPLETELGAPEAFPGTDSRMVQVAPASQHLNAQQVTVVNNLWLSTARSSGQRPIEVARVGRGKDYALVIGSIYGNEPEAMALMDRLNRDLRSAAPPDDLIILMVRTPNPDGLAEHIRTNARGVDLNRNFPSSRFTLNPTPLTGTHPASEPETQFLMRVFKEYGPSRVIHVRSSIGNRPMVLVNDPWNLDALSTVLNATADVNRFTGDLKAGSLEEFVQERAGLPMATVFLPPQGFGELSSRDLMHLVTSPVAARSPGSTPGDNVAGHSSPTPASRTVTDGAKGDVVLLPPPPGTHQTSAGEGGAATRFEELPPPPR